MMIRSNIPSIPILYAQNVTLHIGDEVRILLKNRSGYIGRLANIQSDKIAIEISCSRSEDLEYKEIAIAKILKIRKRKNQELFDTHPYFDEEEKLFWQTHVIGRNGIAKR